MNYEGTIKINFRGGIISPGDLYNILVAAGKAGVLWVRFGLRQQLLIDAGEAGAPILMQELDALGVEYECDDDSFPNMISSYAAEELFITNTWLSEGTYKDIFDLMDYRPRLKINVSDCNQSFTPLLTGNINWVASPTAPHFWHLFIRFPKTNVVYEWNDMVYTNDLPRASRQIEALIFRHKNEFFNNSKASGDALYSMMQSENYITKPVIDPLVLPAFNLPYYEGLNRYNDKFWLGIYRRDELFSVAFLKALCQLCLDTRIGQLCSTPWKSLIIKGIEERDRWQWNNLLSSYQVNMRHAANELNFQVEDNSKEALALKKYLVKQLGKDDVRTFGICVGIKTNKKSEVFSSILVKRRPLLSIAGRGFFHVYDILCAKNFNPNERTAYVFSRSNPKIVLAEQLRRAVLSFYAHQQNEIVLPERTSPRKEMVTRQPEFVHQCRHCLTVYTEESTDLSGNSHTGIAFEELPETYHCPLCDAGKEAFALIEKTKLGLEFN